MASRPFEPRLPDSSSVIIPSAHSSARTATCTPVSRTAPRPASVGNLFDALDGLDRRYRGPTVPASPREGDSRAALVSRMVLLRAGHISHTTPCADRSMVAAVSLSGADGPSGTVHGHLYHETDSIGKHSVCHARDADRREHDQLHGMAQRMLSRARLCVSPARSPSRCSEHQHFFGQARSRQRSGRPADSDAVSAPACDATRGSAGGAGWRRMRPAPLRTRFAGCCPSESRCP